MRKHMEDLESFILVVNCDIIECYKCCLYHKLGCQEQGVWKHDEICHILGLP